MPAIAKRVPDASTWYAPCPEHPRFRSLRGSMRLALKQAQDHNRMMHPDTDETEALRAALRQRKEGQR